MSDYNYPFTAVITWRAQEEPAIPSEHRYRANVNIDGLVIPDVNVGRPGHEEWQADQLVYPLNIGDRIHGDRIGKHLQFQYTERPVIGTCEDLPGGGGSAVVTPTDTGQPVRVSAVFRAIAALSETELAAIGGMIDAAKRSKGV